MPNDEDWSSAKKQFGFVSDLEALRPEIKGKGNLARFDYWLKTMQSLRIMGEYGCKRYQFENAMEESRWTEALEYRISLARLFEKILTLQIEKAVNVSDLGEIVNMEILNWYQLMDLKWENKLVQGLGEELPPEAHPSRDYTGKTSIICTTRQTLINRGDKLELKILIAGEHSSPVVKLRPLGSGSFQSLALQHIARGVYQISLPESENDFEYFIQADSGSETIYFPAGAPGINHAVIVQDTSSVSCQTNQAPSSINRSTH